MDDADRAGAWAEQWRGLVLDKQRRDGAEPAGGTGRCRECGEPIPAERLRARPGALRCVGCQEELEHCANVGLRDGGRGRAR